MYVVKKSLHNFFLTWLLHICQDNNCLVEILVAQEIYIILLRFAVVEAKKYKVSIHMTTWS